MTEKFEFDIDDLKFLTIEQIISIKNTCLSKKLNVNDVLNYLFERALNEYILENENLLFDNLKSETSLIYDKIENVEYNMFNDLFTIDELIRESKKKTLERQREGEYL